MNQLIFGVAMLALSWPAPALAGETQGQNIRIAELEIDPAQLESYKAALQEEIDTSVRIEPGVLALSRIHRMKWRWISSARQFRM